MTLGDLSRERLDQLTELCNISVGHAAGALAKLVHGTPIRLEVPRVKVVDLKALGAAHTDAKRDVAVVSLAVEGDLAGAILLWFEPASAKRLLTVVLKSPKHSNNLEDVMARSTLAEVGNILASAFLSVFGKMTKIKLLPSVPDCRLSSLSRGLEACRPSTAKNAEGLLIEIEMNSREHRFSANFVFVPDPAALKKLESML